MELINFMVVITFWINYSLSCQECLLLNFINKMLHRNIFYSNLIQIMTGQYTGRCRFPASHQPASKVLRVHNNLINKWNSQTGNLEPGELD